MQTQKHQADSSFTLLPGLGISHNFRRFKRYVERLATKQRGRLTARKVAARRVAARMVRQERRAKP